MHEQCTCQYGNDGGLRFTPFWYISVKTCPLHSHLYNPGLAPEWWDVATNSFIDTRKKN